MCHISVKYPLHSNSTTIFVAYIPNIYIYMYRHIPLNCCKYIWGLYIYILYTYYVILSCTDGKWPNFLIPSPLSCAVSRRMGSADHQGGGRSKSINAIPDAAQKAGEIHWNPHGYWVFPKKIMDFFVKTMEKSLFW